MTRGRVGAETTVSRRLFILLSELEEELQKTLKLLTQLKVQPLTEEQKENILGELSAAILHLHEHTRGLDEIIMKDR